MAKLVRTTEGQTRLFMKGSPDKLLPLATASNPDFATAAWEQRITQLSTQGKRVVAVGYRDLPTEITAITP